MRFNNLLQQLPLFADRLESALESLNMLETCRDFEMDHICVRLETDRGAENLQDDLDDIGTCLSTAMINGRQIMIYNTAEPMRVGSWHTSGLELPYPKPSSFYKTGWEHVEFVMSGAENSLAGIGRAFDGCFPHLKHHTYKQMYQRTDSEPQANGDQAPNPTVAITVAGIGIKFHAFSIQTVVGANSTNPSH